MGNRYDLTPPVRALVLAAAVATLTSQAAFAVDQPLVSRWVAAGIDDPEPPRSGERVLLVGSSSIRGWLGTVFAAHLAQLGLRVERHGVSSSGLSRPDFHDWPAEVARLAIGDDVAAVLIYVGVNDPQGIWLRPEERAELGVRDPWLRWHHPRWARRYARRVRALIDDLCHRGARRVVVLTPADVRSRRLQERLRRVRAAQIQGARDSRCGRAVATAGDALELRQPEPGAPPLRTPDGYHFSAVGAERLWQRVAPHLLRVLGGIPVATEADTAASGRSPGPSGGSRVDQR